MRTGGKTEECGTGWNQEKHVTAKTLSKDELLRTLASLHSYTLLFPSRNRQTTSLCGNLLACHLAVLNIEVVFLKNYENRKYNAKFLFPWLIPPFSVQFLLPEKTFHSYLAVYTFFVPKTASEITAMWKFFSFLKIFGSFMKLQTKTTHKMSYS